MARHLSVAAKDHRITAVQLDKGWSLAPSIALS